MSKLCLKISMSLDGFVAGPRQSVENPLGVGGMRLHEWVFPLKVWRSSMQGLEGGEVNESSAVVEESIANIGATVMGRNMFGGHPGPWDAVKPWTGWWGTNPPFRHPVFVVTHHARAPLGLEGGTSFTFVTDGIEAALEQARRAARGKDVSLAGGADVARQYLAAGLVDEMWIHLAPVLLGSGERLFDGGGDDLHGLKLARTVAAPAVTHLKFVRGTEERRHFFGHGRLSYVQIPASNVRESGEFYAKVFGWRVRGGDDAHLSFTDGTGDVIGAWVTHLPISREPGVLPYVYVQGLDETLERVWKSGGVIVTAPQEEGDVWVATFRDPAGNVVGVWQKAPRWI